MRPDLQSSVMGEAGQEAGVSMRFQQLVKAFWLEEASEGQRKRKKEERRPRNRLTRCTEAAVNVRVC